MASGEIFTTHDRAVQLISWSRRNRNAFRFCLLFALYAIFFIVLIGRLSMHTGLLENLSEFLAVVTGLVVNAMGVASRSVGVLVIHNNEFAIEITSRCTGILQVAFFTSAVLALPYHLQAKRVPLALGAALIIGANLLRIIAVYLVGIFAFPWVHLVHDIAGELFMIAVTIMAWLGAMRSAGKWSDRFS
jgi:exosortase/archaeosortase family protein